MSKPSNYGPSFDAEDAIGGFLDVAAKVCFYGGLLALGVSSGFLVYYFFAFASAGGAMNEAAALSNIDLLSKVMVAGAVAGAVGSTYLFWGEETLSVLQLVVSGALWFAPFYLPMTVANTANSKAGGQALISLQQGGTILGILSLATLLVELSLKVRTRMQQGAKADQLKYGKGIKEERDVKNVFLGKCWQLPFCRKFVRERCPIYHSRRTCWKERVGCMCEEEVIRNAMENRPIPKDVVAAGKYIPVNNKITGAQKRERCRQCVIFNEHLKHKYRLFLPITICGFILLSVAAWSPLQSMTGGIIDRLNDVFKRFSLNPEASVSGALGNNAQWFQTVFLVCFLVVALAYALKVLEYVIFKLKV